MTNNVEVLKSTVREALDFASLVMSATDSLDAIAAASKNGDYGEGVYFISKALFDYYKAFQAKADALYEEAKA